jgi:fermentation-respiration switch protein FrsA (DUF1100 family)
MSRGVRRLLVAGALILGLYGAGIGVLYANQRSLIFPAPHSFPPLPSGFEQVAFRTADGLVLAAAWKAPRAGRPVVLFFHGNGDSWTGGASAMAGLAEAGYGIFLPDYRGYGGNPGKPSEAGFYLDGRAALAWLKSKGFAEQQVLLVGNSIGAGTATQLATEMTPAALILISPFSSLPDAVAERLPWVPTRLLVRDKFDNSAKLGQISAPILILHGTADGLIPPTHAQRLKQRNPSAKLVLVPDVGHELAYLLQAQRAQMDWLAGL